MKLWVITSPRLHRFAEWWKRKFYREDGISTWRSRLLAMVYRWLIKHSVNIDA